MDETAVVGNLGNQVRTSSTYGDPQFINPLGLVGHLLVQFWTRSSWKFDGERGYDEITIDPNKYHIIGCDEDQRKQLLRYRSHFDGCTTRSYDDDEDDYDYVPKGVIGRVCWYERPEMSPNISYYSEDEYPHRDFALSCGILSSFCFSFRFSGTFKVGVVEIVSTCNQDVGTLRKFCQSFKGLDWAYSFPHHDFQKYAIPEIDHFFKVVCQTFHLPLAQYWKNDDETPYLVHQFSYRDSEKLTPWCQFKDACLHKNVYLFEGPLGILNLSREAFFCRDITALSITKYPFAHYARNCGSISCFTICLRSIAQPDEESDEEQEWKLEFFQQIDNDYPQTFFNSLWAIMKDCLPNHMLASGEQLAQGFSVKVIKSKSSTSNEPMSFEVGQPSNSSTTDLSEYSTEQSINSDYYEEAATEETSKTILNEASQPRRSEGCFEIKGKGMVAERVNELVEESPIEDTGYATSNVDVGCATSIVDTRNAMTTESQPSGFQTKVTLHQQVEETTVLENEGDASQQLPPNLQLLFEYGAEQDMQVPEIIESTQNISSYEEISTVEQIICYELEESPIKCIEPQSLTSQARRSEEIIRDDGYTVASERVNKQVEVSPGDDIVVTPASKRLKKSQDH